MPLGTGIAGHVATTGNVGFKKDEHEKEEVATTGNVGCQKDDEKEKEEDGNFGLKRMTNKTNKNMPPQWLRLKWMKFNKLAKLRR